MSDFLAAKFNIKEIINKKFPEADYEVNIVDDEIIINKNGETDKLTITFSAEELSDSISNIKEFFPNYILGEGFLNIILYDINDKFEKDKTINIKGSLKGLLKKDFSTYYITIFLTFISNPAFLNFEKAEFGETIRLEDLVNEKYIICDIQNFSPATMQVSNVINSIITQVSYHNNLLLSLPQANAPSTIIHNYNDIENSEYINNNDIMHYFISGEELTHLHSKYLEYYHVLEYFFLESTIKKIKKVLKNASLKEQAQNKQLSSEEYYSVGKDIEGIFKKEDSYREELQLIEIVTNEIGFEIIKLASERANFSFPKFNTPLLEIEATRINTANVYRNGFIGNDAEKNDFCIALAKRIYKIRNHIVHTKKGEKLNIFTPSFENLIKLKEEVEFMKHLSYLTILSKKN